MLKCDVFKNRMSLSIDGLLNEIGKSEFDSHLNTCDSCVQEYNILNKVVSDLNNIGQVDIPLDFKSKLHIKLEEVLKNKKKENKKNYNRYLKVITSVAACLIVVFTVKLYLDNTNSNNMNIESFNDDIKPSIMMVDSDTKEESLPKVNETISEKSNEMAVQVLDVELEEKAIKPKARTALIKTAEEILEIIVVTDNISKAKENIINVIKMNNGLIVDDENDNTIIIVTKEAYSIYSEIKSLYPKIIINKEIETLKDDKTEIRIKILIEKSTE